MIKIIIHQHCFGLPPIGCHWNVCLFVFSQVQFIHCIVQYQGEGGESLIADAANVARQLQQTCPEHYRVLSNTPVDWFDRGADETGEFYKVLRLPIIW